jgi:predicted SnoaL-like aldol condensation-catalyzing enzyme
MPMKKFLFPAIAAVLFLISCNQSASTGSSAGESDKAKKNVDNAKAIAGMFEKGDFSKVGDYIATDVVDHAGPTGEMKGLDSLKKMFDMYAGMVKDSKVEIVKTLGDDDYVFMWLKQSWTATVDDPGMHLKAGEHGHMESVEVTKHNADSKISEHWSFMSMADAMKMMSQGNMNMGNEKMGGEKMGKDTSANKMQKK